MLSKRFLESICDKSYSPFSQFFLFSGIGIAQDNSIDNQVWQTVEQDDYRFRLPATWQNVDNIWQHPDLPLTIMLKTNNPDEIDSPGLIDESVELPLAESRKITFEQDGIGTIAYIINHQGQGLFLLPGLIQQI